MKLLSYQRHFLALGVATFVLATIESRLTLTGDWGLITAFALYGALHGVAVCFGLRSEHGAVKQLSFIGLAACASVAAPVAGFAITRFLFPSGVEGDLFLLFPIAAASISGAAIYWIVLKIYWFPVLTMGSLIFTIVVCAFVSPASYFIAAALTGFGASDVPAADLVPTVGWWFSFSLTLFLWDQMRHRGRPIYNGS
jgi:hypothetical protein